MINTRGYLTNYGGSQDWPSLDMTTRVKYLIHIATDCGVPLGHSPANEVYNNTIGEALLEAQVSSWSDYPSIVGASSYTHSRTGYSTNFSGTYSQILTKFYNACLNNATWFKSTKNSFGMHSSDDNRAAGWNGTTLGLYLGRAMLADLFLAEQPTVANANGSYAVYPGGAVTFSSAGSYDPDSITWNSDGTYYNNGGGFSCAWDLNGDGTFETSGASPTRSYSQLASLVGYTEGRQITLRVADTEPGVYQKTSTATAMLAVYANPIANALPQYSARPGESVLFSADAYDPDGGSIEQWLWDLTGDGQYNNYSGTGSLTYNEIVAQGVPVGESKNIYLKVVDNEGQVGYDTAELYLLPAEPNEVTLGLADNGSPAPGLHSYTLTANGTGITTLSKFTIDGAVHQVFHAGQPSEWIGDGSASWSDESDSFVIFGQMRLPDLGGNEWDYDTYPEGPPDKFTEEKILGGADSGMGTLNNFNEGLGAFDAYIELSKPSTTPQPVELMQLVVAEDSGFTANVKLLTYSYYDPQTGQPGVKEHFLSYTLPGVFLPGDANHDGFVDERDAAAMAQNWLSSGDWADGDFNNDGLVDERDAALLAANWTGSPQAAVPEPGAWILLAFAALLVWTMYAGFSFSGCTD